MSVNEAILDLLLISVTSPPPPKPKSSSSSLLVPVVTHFCEFCCEEYELLTTGPCVFAAVANSAARGDSDAGAGPAGPVPADPASRLPPAASGPRWVHPGGGPAVQPGAAAPATAPASAPAASTPEAEGR